MPLSCFPPVRTVKTLQIHSSNCFEFDEIRSTSGLRYSNCFELITFRTSSTTTGDRNPQFWGPVSTGFLLNFLQWIFVIFLQVSCVCNLVRKSPPNVEKIARFLGGEESVESCHVSGCQGQISQKYVTFFGAPRPEFFLAKCSAEKVKCINISQPPNQGDER